MFRIKRDFIRQHDYLYEVIMVVREQVIKNLDKLQADNPDIKIIKKGGQLIFCKEVESVDFTETVKKKRGRKKK